MGGTIKGSRGAKSAREELHVNVQNITSSPSGFAAVSLEGVVSTQTLLGDLVHLGWHLPGGLSGGEGHTGYVVLSWTSLWLFYSLFLKR